MNKNHGETIHKGFEIEKKVYLNEISVSGGADNLADTGLKRGWGT